MKSHLGSCSQNAHIMKKLKLISMLKWMDWTTITLLWFFFFKMRNTCLVQSRSTLQNNRCWFWFSGWLQLLLWLKSVFMREKMVYFRLQPSDSTSWPNARSCTCTLFSYGGPPGKVCQGAIQREAKRGRLTSTPHKCPSSTSRRLNAPAAQALYHCFYYYHCIFSFHLCTKKNKQYISGGWSTPT